MKHFKPGQLLQRKDTKQLMDAIISTPHGILVEWHNKFNKPERAVIPAHELEAATRFVRKG